MPILNRYFVRRVPPNLRMRRVRFTSTEFPTKDRCEGRVWRGVYAGAG